MIARLPMTLTGKLASLYAIATLIILACVGTYLYRALASQLAARDDHELRNLCSSLEIGRHGSKH